MKLGIEIKKKRKEKYVEAKRARALKSPVRRSSNFINPNRYQTLLGSIDCHRSDPFL